MQQRVLWVGIVSIAAIAFIAGILFFMHKPSLHGAVINPPLPAADIQLKDSNGQPFTLNSLRGQVVVLYFGYTNCPDECPLTMAHLKQAVDLLGSSSNGVQVIMVTTDPGRDTQSVLKDWLGKFNSDFIGLYGTTDELTKVWKDYGVTVEDGGETHSNFVYIIDRKGYFRETFLPDSLPADEAADFRLLLSEK